MTKNDTFGVEDQDLEEIKEALETSGRDLHLGTGFGFEKDTCIRRKIGNHFQENAKFEKSIWGTFLKDIFEST